MEQKMNIPLDGTPVNVEHVFAAYPDLIPFKVDKLITQAAFFRWPNSTVISCSLTLDNGSVELGESQPRDETRFTEADGIKHAFMRARDKVWPILAYLERGINVVHN